jgi:hypothetical protein
MAIAEINIWLDGTKDFTTGKAIYLQYGEDDVFIKQLNLPVTSFLKRKLTARLRALNEDAKQILLEKAIASQKSAFPPKCLPEFIPPKNYKRPSYNRNDLSAFVKTRDDLRKLTWAQLNEFRKMLTKDTENKTDLSRNVELIKKIKALDKKLDLLWDEINHYLATGEELLQEDEVNLPLHVLVKKRNNIRSYVSKYRGKPGQEAKYNRYQSDLIRLEGLIDAN